MVTLITLVCRGCFLGTALVSSVLLPAAGVICLDLDDLLIQNELLNIGAIFILVDLVLMYVYHDAFLKKRTKKYNTQQNITDRNTNIKQVIRTQKGSETQRRKLHRIREHGVMKDRAHLKAFRH